jgi:hypothetical protein
MNNESYLKLMSALNYGFDNNKKLIIYWDNGLKIKCTSLTGEYETDTEPGDEDYIGEYAAGVNEVEILEKGKDDSVKLYNNSMEISLINILEKIFLEDGSVLWQREE